MFKSCIDMAEKCIITVSGVRNNISPNFFFNYSSHDFNIFSHMFLLTFFIVT